MFGILRSNSMSYQIITEKSMRTRSLGPIFLDKNLIIQCLRVCGMRGELRATATNNSLNL